MSRVLEVRFFGRAAVRWGETDLQLDARPRCVPLLAKLVLEAGSPVERRQVAGLLWPDDDEERARANLRRHLHWLLQRLPSREEPWIFADHGTLRWNERAPWRCDATELLAAVARGETDIDDIPAGDFLEGVDDSWTIGERSRLRTAMVEHLASAAIVARATGAADRAERLARRALPFEPFDERLVRTLMAALADQGRRSEALAVFSAHEHRCRTELDARPDDETSDFAKALRDGALPQPVPTNLTPPPVRFFGRARELTDVRGLLATRRLVTLTGPGGIGKTRLATEIALRELARQPDGVFLADLSSIADDASIVAAIASAVGAPLRVAGPEGLIAGIGRARMLLVLDNVEHVIGETSRIVERLLRGCPALRVLLTSREPLRSAGEVVRRLGPMLVPDEEAASTEEVRGSEAVRYFVERARDVDAGFALDRRSAAPVAMICRRLDGIPLALELAAARLGTTDARSLAASLERHCTLESTIAWSLDLLDEAHRAQAIDASVLPGSFDAELARAVLDENAPAFLVEHSLLHYEGGAHPRYRMLEPIRLVLAQRLAPQRETELRERYARAVIARTLRISPDLEGSRQTEAVNQVASDDHHVRSALVWCIEERHDTTAGLRLAGALSPYWIARSMFAEGVRWGEAALASADDVPSHERATVLQLIGSSSYYIRDFARAESAIRAALRAFETLGGAYGIARATNSLGVIALSREQLDEAEPYFRRVCELSAAGGFVDMEGMALNNLAAIELNRGHFAESIALQRRSIEKYEATGTKRLIAWALNALAGNLIITGELDEAQELLERSLAIYRGLKNVRQITNTLHDLGDVLYFKGDIEAARERYEQSFRSSVLLDEAMLVSQALEGLAAIAVADGDAVRSAMLLGAGRTRYAKFTGFGERAREHVIARIREGIDALIDEAEYAAAYARGERLTDAEVIALASSGEQSAQTVLVEDRHA